MTGPIRSGAIGAALSLVLLLGATGAAHAAAKDREAGAPPLGVLFVGNSYTYGNRLPLLVAGLAEAAGGRRIDVDMVAPGGCTLQRHVEKSGAVTKIGEKKWDAVVLQEQSTMPVVDTKRMHEYARKLHVEIEKQGARTVFFLTWARQHKPEMQRGLDAAYFRIARELKAEVAPVGRAWQAALAADPKRVLHAADKSHPNPAGSYLAACVFYATLLGKSPVGLPAEIRRDGKPLVNLDPKEARALQEIAWKTVEELQREKVPAS